MSAPEPLSPLARAYGAIHDVLRNDTERVLVDLFWADPEQVEAAAEEWFAAHPEPDEEGP